MPQSNQKGFVLDSLPRSGSTTLARILNCHPGIDCILEPFHPRQGFGLFHRLALSERSAHTAINMIFCRWSGLKHVWDAASGWPFPGAPEINEGIVTAAPRVIFLCRRNLLRRFISGHISNQLKYWAGTRQQFLERLEKVELASVDPQQVIGEIARDRLAIERRRELMETSGTPFLQIYYEDLYGEHQTAAEQRVFLGGVLRFLGCDNVSEEVYRANCAPLMSPGNYRWASPETYERLPGVREIEGRAGSDETGWLLK